MRTLLAVAFAVLPLRAGAAPMPQQPAAFTAMLYNPHHVEAVVQAAKQSTVWLRNPCPSAVFTVAHIAIYRVPVFDAAGKPLSGLWGEKLRETGCGVTRLLGTATIVRAPGVVSSGALAPGETTADPLLQRDAASYARPVMMAGHQGCKDAYIMDTAILPKTAASPPGATGPVRFEKWTASVCGSIVPIELMFVPDSTGTRVVASLYKE